jgi:hypothetical protein
MKSWRRLHVARRLPGAHSRNIRETACHSHIPLTPEAPQPRIHPNPQPHLLILAYSLSPTPPQHLHLPPTLQHDLPPSTLSSSHNPLTHTRRRRPLPTPQIFPRPKQLPHSARIHTQRNPRQQDNGSHDDESEILLVVDPGHFLCAFCLLL